MIARITAATLLALAAIGSGAASASATDGPADCRAAAKLVATADRYQATQPATADKLRVKAHELCPSAY